MHATNSADDDDGACGARTGESDSGRRRAAWEHPATPPSPRCPPPRAHSPHGLTVPRPVRPRGATCVGKPTCVVPEEADRSLFLKYTSASAGPRALWRLPA